MFAWWLAHKPIDLEADGEGHPHGGPRSGQLLLSGNSEDWIPETPKKQEAKPDRLVFLFEVPLENRLTFVRSVKHVVSKEFLGGSTYLVDNSTKPRGGYREHAKVEGVGHVSWNPAWPNMLYARVEFFPEALRNGKARWFMHGYVVPVANLASAKVGRRDTAADYLTTRPLAPYVFPRSRKALSWASHAPLCNELTPHVLNTRLGSHHSEVFTRIYDKSAERIDRTVCGRDSACTCKISSEGHDDASSHHQCAVCRPTHDRLYCMRVESVEAPKGGGRHPYDYADPAPNPAHDLRLIDLRHATNEPYALFLLIGCRLHGPRAVRHWLQDGAPSGLARKRLGLVFDAMLEHYAAHTALTPPATLYEQTRANWRELVRDLWGMGAASRVPAHPDDEEVMAALEANCRDAWDAWHQVQQHHS